MSPSTKKPAYVPAKAQDIPVPETILTQPAIRVMEQPDGGIRCEFLISATDAHRLRIKAQQIPLERWLYDNVIRNSLSSALY